MQERQVTIGDTTVSAAGAVRRHRHAESDRARGNVCAAGSAGRSFRDEAASRLSRGDRGAAHARAVPRSDARVRVSPARDDARSRSAKWRSSRRACTWTSASDATSCSSSLPRASRRKRKLPRSPRTSPSALRRARRSPSRTSRRRTRSSKGATYVVPEDVKAIAHDVLRHRLVLSYEAAAENVTADRIIDQVLNAVAVP